MDGQTTFTVQYGGQQFMLSLRVADDGFIPAFEEAAVQLAIAPFLLHVYTLPEEFWSDEVRVCRLMNLIVAEAQDGGWRRTAPDGQVAITPIPWRSWLDLDRDEIRPIVEGFFLRSAQKIGRLKTSKTFMGHSLQACIVFASALVTADSSMPSTPPEA
jgi:hypothetical protein